MSPSLLQLYDLILPSFIADEQCGSLNEYADTLARAHSITLNYCSDI